MHADKMDEFKRNTETSLLGGGQGRIEAQHSKGKLTARERITLLLDESSFVEIDSMVTHHYHEFDMQKRVYYNDGVVGGYGTINSRQVFVFAYDFTVLGGTLSQMGAKKITKLMDHAVRTGCPIIGIMDSGGARIQEGIMSLDGFADIFYHNQMASGVIPQITASIGPSAGGSVYSPAMTDFIVMVEKVGSMFVTGPDVVKTVLGEEISFDELGGAMTHGTKSGVAHFVAQNEYECFDYIRDLLSYMPQNNSQIPPSVSVNDDPSRTNPDMLSLIPTNPLQPYDMKDIINGIVDDAKFFEIHKLFAQNIIVGFARLNGMAIGVVANQPTQLAGALDIDSSNKAARFIRFCDSFNIPIVTFVDTPGYMPGSDQEHNGIIRHGSKLLYAYCEATVPKITLVIGKAYGGAYIAMGSKNLRTDVNYAWPTARCAVLGAEAAVKIMNRKDIQNAEDPSRLLQELKTNFEEKFDNPYVAASHGTVDAVIDPAQTRPMLIKALAMLSNKRDKQLPRKHGNINL
ncbi:MAG: acyl-CoA carboxylase subunit beta [Cenarchaeum sp. SB0661_bin_35]|nr:acyl-CoA carboxylase subunit beta [Cenarchaeum sp. SB0667_bin_13]MXY38120.1 acyl-CoA carboxylase subunit beta [Cenarchaeum sp. SB0664_bin_35]MYB47549.1 acyl-CoA carboxylase subunit beta [Cenarchaeum sp. SB0662_bin_33]MYC79817.1 acyl-CoA carboxylase subunit beta [Cenarchaeum sp. SB0661_bin_35]MYG32795.1 acyl-CoA carboxylase subunit beta [Cenarchaeum sp. SB0677_bin_16]